MQFSEPSIQTDTLWYIKPYLRHGFGLQRVGNTLLLMLVCRWVTKSYYKPSTARGKNNKYSEISGTRWERVGPELSTLSIAERRETL